MDYIWFRKLSTVCIHFGNSCSVIVMTVIIRLTTRWQNEAYAPWPWSVRTLCSSVAKKEQSFCYLPFHYWNLQATWSVCKGIYQELPERSLFGKNRLAELNSCQDLHLKLIIIKNSPSKCVYLSDRCSKASFSLDTSFLDAYSFCDF